MELRRASADDIALFDRIADDVFDEPIVSERLRQYLAEPGHLMILAVDDGVVVGQCAAVIHRHPDKVTELYIDELGTAPARQRQGIGRKMIDAMFEWGRELGCKESWLGTELDNDAANALYRDYQPVENEAIQYYLFQL